MATKPNAQPAAQPTLVPQAAANAAGYLQNSAYRNNNMNDYGPFDTLAFQRNLAQYAFFLTSVGQNGKTAYDTNMIAGGQFPLGRNVVVKGIGFHFHFAGFTGTANYAAQIQALYTILENSYIDFRIQGRDFEFQAPGTYWLPEIALANQVTVNSSSTGADVAVASSYQRMGDYIRHGGYQLQIPIALQNLLPWQMNWNVNVQDAAVQAALVTLTPTDLAPARMRWQLKGTLEQGT